MGFYLRKSFRAGPIRFNLSKSGLGISGGVKGARIGVGTRGAYVHGGRHGLYYRKNLSSSQSRCQSAADGESSAMLFIAVIAIGIGVWLFHWLMSNPATAVALGVGSIAWFIRHRRKQTVRLYKQSLDATFVTAASAPSAAALNTIRQQQAGLPRTQSARQAIENIESEVYQAILDKVLDDGFISREESATIAAAEQTLRMDRQNACEPGKTSSPPPMLRPFRIKR